MGFVCKRTNLREEEAEGWLMVHYEKRNKVHLQEHMGSTSR